jgi:DNA-binding NtrC family response regulator
MNTAPPRRATVLLVTQHESVARLVRSATDALGQVALQVSANHATVFAEVRRAGADVLLLHITPTVDCAEVIELLQLLRTLERPVVGLLLGDAARPRDAEALLRAGAAAYFEGVPELQRLKDVIQGAALARRGEEEPADAVGPFGLVRSCQAGNVNEQMRRVIRQDATILLTGETGTGKTRLARLIHELSPRAAEPFHVIDCGAMNPELIESEMFGHVKGAFTGAERDRVGKFAAAGGGTLLLDSISSLPLALQAKLLRAVDERTFEPVGSERPLPLRARLMAAGNIPLETLVAAGRFRADLFFRINVVSFRLQPLRERPELIVPLARQFLAEFAVRNRPDVQAFAAATRNALKAYSWPGNIRELRNVIERAVALCPGPEIVPADLPEAVERGHHAQPALPGAAAPPVAAASPPSTTLLRTRAHAEATRISEALVKHQNNRCRAAAELGISRMALYNKLHKYNLLDRD